MSSRYKVHHDYVPHFITCTVVSWIDALSREHYKEIVVESLNYCISKKGLQLHAWVIMSNHLHMILSASEGSRISNIVRDFKKFTSRKITDAITTNIQESRRAWMLGMFGYAGMNNKSNDQYQFWQQDYHPIALDRKDMFEQRMGYLHDNPVRAGLVWEAAHYKYSSAGDYYENRMGLLPLIKL
ncbi:MAG TPA: transposase [Flavipsychrobacter sp.]|nr:transposase [Flavipsychrobacter sp.]HRO41419.1 transposase [Flavipsychrobacter sp.]